MPPETIENRVDHLERRMTDMETLPDRITAIESQIVQLRAEMRVEFSTVRQEIRTGDEETRRVLGERIDENGRHMRVLHEDVIGRLAIIQEGQSPRRKDG
jgi:predicted phage gp36 major capsid-like protein